MKIRNDILIKRIAPVLISAVAVSALYGNSVYADGNIIESVSVNFGDNIVIGAGYYEEDTTIQIPTKEEFIARGADEGGITPQDLIDNGVDLGNATANNVLANKTFSSSVAGANQSGTMPDETGVTQAGSSTTISNNLLRTTVPVTGYYVKDSSYLTVDAGTATKAQVLSGKTFTSTAGVKVSGQMADKTGVSAAASIGGIENNLLKFTVPETGYYVKDSSYLTASVGTATRAEVLSGKTFTSTAGVNAAGQMKNNAGATKASAAADISNNLLRARISETAYYDTTSYITVDVGTATRAQVLSGKTFTSTAGVKTTGQMNNNGALNWAPSGSESKTITEGYYSGGTISTANAYSSGYNAGITYADSRSNPASDNYKAGYDAGVAATKKGTATRAQVLSGWTFTSAAAGVNQSGSIPVDQAKTYSSGGTTTASDITLDSGASISIAAGYYSASTTVRAKPAQSKSATPTGSSQTISPDSGYVLSSVSVSAVTKNDGIGKSLYDEGYAAGLAATPTVNTQNKSATPKSYSQTITPDSGYYLSSVVVTAVTKNDGGIGQQLYNEGEANVISGIRSLGAQTVEIKETCSGSGGNGSGYETYGGDGHEYHWVKCPVCGGSWVDDSWNDIVPAHQVVVGTANGYIVPESLLKSYE